MSDQEQPPSPTPPRGSRGEKPSGGFNWRVFILFGVALVILVIAWETSDVNKNAQKISLPAFQTEWERGRVVVVRPDDPNAALKQKQFPLKLISSDAGAMLRITGFLLPEDTVPKVDKSDQVRPFRVPLSVIAQATELKDLLRDGINYRVVDELPAAEGADILTLDQFRSVLAKGAVLTDEGVGTTPLAILTENEATSAIIVGERYITGEPKLDPNSLEALNEKVLTPFYVPLDLRMTGPQDLAFFSDSAVKEVESSTMQNILVSLLPFLLLILLLFFLFRFQMKSAGRGAMSFGKSKAKLMNMNRNKVTFKDVAGIDEAKEELNEIVEFLKDPKRFQKLGGNIPKGVLMAGAPGTGKTLLARAIAGEADVPFFSISGSDFVEMFVGVGASRVRDMFEQGRKNAPCLIFIDEIDAVGRHRGQGMGGGNDEREQTLNAMLVEMDGFDSQEGVIIIAATNRPDVLDPALLRPGRFDRQVTVSLPDVIGREQILKVHVKKIKIADGVDLGVIARGTPGFSGAELANLINESALLAARKRLKAVTLAELEEARDKVRWGRERRSLALTEEDKRKTAYHEAGHSVLQVTLENTDPIHKVTIIPRGPALGSMMYLPERDKFSQHRNEMLDNLVVLMGGRVAEEIMLDDIANGAMGDIRMATNIARSMVCEWGMSPELGMVEYKDSADGYMPGNAQYSEAFAQKIDQEIKRFTDEAYRKATEILTEKKDKLELIAEALMEYETLDGQHIIDLMEHGEMKDPPPSPKPPAVPPAEPVQDTPVQKDEQPEDDEDGPIGDPLVAPA